ncbi:MAG: hypothetical protein HY610_00885 [Elusimicrobia bacterium]|nr:hypothetical protein [Elusimicrobiota bacterium]
MKEKMMRLSPEEREKAAMEYQQKMDLEKHENRPMRMREESQSRSSLHFSNRQDRNEGGSSMGPSEEDKKHMSAEDHAAVQKIMQMPPEQREAAAQEYKTRRMQETMHQMQGQEGQMGPSEEDKKHMTPEDWAMVEKIKSLPPEQREATAQEYKMKRMQESMQQMKENSQR